MPSVLRSSGHSASPCAIASRRAAERHALAVHDELAAVRCVQPEQQPRQLGAARAQQARRRRRSRRGLMLEIGRLQLPLARQALAPAAPARPRRRSRARCARRSPAAPRSRGPPSPRSAPRGSARSARYSPTKRAVAQHGDAIGDRIHLVEEMRDEQDRHALAAQAIQHGEELLAPRLRRGSRWAHRESARAPNASRARDRHHLLNRPPDSPTAAA